MLLIDLLVQSGMSETPKTREEKIAELKAAVLDLVRQIGELQKQIDALEDLPRGTQSSVDWKHSSK